MPSQDLTITIIQPDLAWEDRDENLRRFAGKLDAILGHKEVVLLPEMFSTGFSMQPQKLAEGIAGPTVQWMAAQAARHRVILAGSVIIEEDGRYYNRLIWMQPDGQSYHYDKRHLFGFAGEDAHYAPGDRRVIVQAKGWKIALQVCYDLRFPVWARQTPNAEPYDLLLYVANWPERRALAWRTLLQARAIENQCYVAGVNRVGTDGNGIQHSGDSRIIDPMGEVLWECSGKEATHTLRLSHEALRQTREKLPFLRDGDGFVLC